MKKFITSWFSIVGLTLMIATTPATAQQLGGEYSILPSPVPSESKGKIEVVEFFSYACPHCNTFNPLLTEWAKQLPADVVFRKEAVQFTSPFYRLTARLFYALEAMGEEERLNAAIFRAIHNEGVKLTDEKSATAWVATQGVDRKKFGAAFNSTGVIKQLERSEKLVEEINLPGVPALIVDGRYLVGGPEIKSFKQMLTVADQLLAKARAERDTKK